MYIDIFYTVSSIFWLYGLSWGWLSKIRVFHCADRSVSRTRTNDIYVIYRYILYAFGYWPVGTMKDTQRFQIKIPHIQIYFVRFIIFDISNLWHSPSQPTESYQENTRLPTSEKINVPRSGAISRWTKAFSFQELTSNIQFRRANVI